APAAAGKILASLGLLLEEALLGHLPGAAFASHHPLVELFDALVQLGDLALVIPGNPVVLILQALNFLFEVGDGLSPAFHVAPLRLELFGVLRNLLILFREADAPLLLLLL